MTAEKRANSHWGVVMSLIAGDVATPPPGTSLRAYLREAEHSGIPFADEAIEIHRDRMSGRMPTPDNAPTTPRTRKHYWG